MFSMLLRKVSTSSLTKSSVTASLEQLCVSILKTIQDSTNFSGMVFSRTRMRTDASHGKHTSNSCEKLELGVVTLNCMQLLTHITSTYVFSLLLQKILEISNHDDKPVLYLWFKDRHYEWLTGKNPGAWIKEKQIAPYERGRGGAKSSAASVCTAEADVDVLFCQKSTASSAIRTSEADMSVLAKMRNADSKCARGVKIQPGAAASSASSKRQKLSINCNLATNSAHDDTDGFSSAELDSPQNEANVKADDRKQSEG